MAEQWPLLLIALIPAVLVFLTAFYLIRQFLQDQRSALRAERVDSGKRDDHRQLLPLRLQAYERLALFLERITPGALVFRVHKSHMTSRMLHAELLATIRPSQLRYLREDNGDLPEGWTVRRPDGPPVVVTHGRFETLPGGVAKKIHVRGSAIMVRSDADGGGTSAIFPE